MLGLLVYVQLVLKVTLLRVVVRDLPCDLRLVVEAHDADLALPHPAARVLELGSTRVLCMITQAISQRYPWTSGCGDDRWCAYVQRLLLLLGHFALCDRRHSLKTRSWKPSCVGIAWHLRCASCREGSRDSFRSACERCRTRSFRITTSTSNDCISDCRVDGGTGFALNGGGFCLVGSGTGLL